MRLRTPFLRTGSQAPLQFVEAREVGRAQTSRVWSVRALTELGEFVGIVAIHRTSLALRRAAHQRPHDKGPAEAGPLWATQLPEPPKFLKRWLNFSTRPAESMMRCLPV